MGSTISLGVENFEIDWGKNQLFRNHSCLFLPSDKIVRWTSFDKKLRQYHGELEEKDAYTDSFLQSGWRCGGYDSSKLTLLWEFLFDRCTTT